MADRTGPAPLRLLRPGTADAAAIEQALRRVPCPFAATLEFAIWQARPVAELPSEPAGRVLGEPAGPKPAVAVELPELTGTTPQRLLPAFTELAGQLGAELRNGSAFTDRAGWWIRAAAGDWFVTVHADCYPDRHSRHWPRPGAVVVLIPRPAFDQGFPAGVPDSTRQAIRGAFRRHGIRYPAGGGAVATG